MTLPAEPADDERILIAAARRGDEDAFAELVRRHQAPLRAFAARWLAVPADVHDVVQEAFIEAYRGLGSFDDRREFGGWVWTICRNRVVGFLRARRRRRAQPLWTVDQALAAQAERAADRGDELAALRGCLAGLAPAQRALIDQRYRDGVRVKDLAARLGRNQTAVSMALARIRDALLRCIRDRLRAEAR